MKKLLLIIATSTALLTSSASFADENQPANVMKANPNEHRFYLKFEGGASKLNTEKLENYSVKVKSNATGILGVGVGYYITDNVRTELTLNFLTNPEFKGSFSNGIDIKVFKLKISGQGKTKGNVKSLLLNSYVDLYATDNVKLFAGAGVGMAQVKEKTTGTIIVEAEVKDEDENEVGKISETFSDSSKNANNFAYQLTAGVSFNLTKSIKLDIAYSWRDYGETKPGEINIKIKDMDVYSEKSGKTPYRGHNLMAGIRFDL
ncbi:outer membrane protein [Candidatus Tisiphia endosymbiont of Mystacides longicornis]|uniref:outer membrane protein n=1 Tax=Candidatus Tisiphia endosymbiont of Mystacides longicornis TaxID=3139330 RepID=UPI003CCB0444